MVSADSTQPTIAVIGGSFPDTLAAQSVPGSNTAASQQLHESRSNGQSRSHHNHRSHDRSHSRSRGNNRLPNKTQNTRGGQGAGGGGRSLSLSAKVLIAICILIVVAAAVIIPTVLVLVVFKDDGLLSLLELLYLSTTVIT